MAANLNRGTTVQNYFSVSEVARKLGVTPRSISDLFYQRELRDDLCPIIAGRRLIPESYLPQIEAVLRHNKRLIPLRDREGDSGKGGRE